MFTDKMTQELTYQQRSDLCENAIAKYLFQLMEEKKTNLALSADVTTSKELLQIAGALGPHICVLKTHIDILSDFTKETPQQLLSLAKKHQFLLFEDRKFADIGNTVKHQCSGGIYQIASWADMINAHIIPGPGIIQGLKETGAKALLLLAQMSSKGTLAKEDYTKRAVELAKEHSDFVIGFICLERLTKDPKFLHFTPGVKKATSHDVLGQQYQTPKHVIEEKKSDIIIVGRGIIEAEDPKKEALLYQTQGWEAYQARL